MSITCIFRLWEILRAINDRPYEKTGIFSIEDVGALRERCERCRWQSKRAERVPPQREGSPV